jgi:hypothetical protein
MDRAVERDITRSAHTGFWDYQTTSRVRDTVNDRRMVEVRHGAFEFAVKASLHFDAEVLDSHHTSKALETAR